MKPEEAIWHYNALKEHYLSCRSFLVRDKIDGISKEVIAMIEKQVPKKPIHAHGNYYCPTCKDTWLLWDDAIPNEHDNFCRYCGQRIDWSVEE